jgi:serine/threonine protein kinase
MAKHDSRGRSSDIYSLGCIFLEVATPLYGKSLIEFERLRNTNGDQSYHGNPQKIQDWLNHLSEIASERGWRNDIFPLIGKMLSEKPKERPIATQVCHELYSRGDNSSSYHMPCCQGSFLTTYQQNQMRNEIEDLKAQIKEKDDFNLTLNQELDALRHKLDHQQKECRLEISQLKRDYQLAIQNGAETNRLLTRKECELDALRHKLDHQQKESRLEISQLKRDYQLAIQNGAETNRLLTRKECELVALKQKLDQQEDNLPLQVRHDGLIDFGEDRKWHGQGKGIRRQYEEERIGLRIRCEEEEKRRLEVEAAIKYR